MDWFDTKTHGALTRMCNTVDIYRNEKMLLAWMTLISIFLIHLNMGAVMYCLLKGLGVDGSTDAGAVYRSHSREYCRADPFHAIRHRIPGLYRIENIERRRNRPG